MTARRRAQSLRTIGVALWMLAVVELLAGPGDAPLVFGHLGVGAYLVGMFYHQVGAARLWITRRLWRLLRRHDRPLIERDRAAYRELEAEMREGE